MNTINSIVIPMLVLAGLWTGVIAPVHAHSADAKVLNLEYRLQRLEQKLQTAQRKELSNNQLLQRQDSMIKKLSAQVQRLERQSLLTHQDFRTKAADSKAEDSKAEDSETTKPKRISRPPIKDPDAPVTREEIELIWQQLEAILAAK